jgi:hypothetical protein
MAMLIPVPEFIQYRQRFTTCSFQRDRKVERRGESSRPRLDVAPTDLRANRSYRRLPNSPHCPRFGYVLDELKREIPNDLDFVSERHLGKRLDELFKGLGYIGDRRIAQATDGQHRYYIHPETQLGVDVYLGSLNYCHPIALEGRLGADPVTIPLAETLLAKLQIVDLTEKDIKDVVVLLLEHDLGTHDDETINAERLQEVLSHDWGFYYSASLNLEKISLWLFGVKALKDEHKSRVLARIETLQDQMERWPKDRRWRLRAKIGPRVRWYQTVEEK